MKLFLLVFLFLATAGACFAQLSLPNVTDSLFDRTDGGVNGRPLLLAPFAGGLTRPGIAAQGEDEETVRQTQPGRGVLEDFHANTQSAIARLGAGTNTHGFWAYLHAEHLANSGTLNQGATVLGLSGNLNESDLGLVWPIRHLALRLSYEHDRYTAGGQSNVYANLFGIFPPEPPLSFEKSEDLGEASVVYQIAPAWNVEADFAEESSPGDVTLTDPTSLTSLTVPISDHGGVYTYTLRYAPSREAAIYAFAGSGSFHGNGNIDREAGLVVGQSTDSRLSRQGGLAWQERFGGSRALTLYGEQDQERWKVAGGIPNPAQIGINLSGARDLGFGADYDIRTYIAGLSWDERYGASHSLYLDYRYGQIFANLAASEGAVLYIFPTGQSTIDDFNNLKGHILQVRYRFPLWRLQAMVGGTQVIPATAGPAGTTSSGSTSGGGAGGSSTGPRHTYGGWAITWQLGYDF